MGRFSSTTHIKNTTDKAGFIRALGEGGWVTFASESDDIPGRSWTAIPR